MDLYVFIVLDTKTLDHNIFDIILWFHFYILHLLSRVTIKFFPTKI